MFQILESISGTLEAEIIKSIDEFYGNIQSKQNEWYEKSKFFCPDGCGECCRNFEPDILESEALYMAAWIIENNPDLAEKICRGEFPFERNGCRFWDEQSAYHCTIYGARPSICRFFGASGTLGKNGDSVFKPCKFYPIQNLEEHKPPLAHRQYTSSELKNIFGTVPPMMSDLMEEIVDINPDNKETKLIHEILPEMIKKLLWIQKMCRPE